MDYIVAIGLLVVAAVASALAFWHRTRFRALSQHISCLELMKRIINTENTMEGNRLEGINKTLKEYFKADASILLDLQDGITVKAATGSVDGIEYMGKYKEFQEATQAKEIRMVRVAEQGRYTAAEKRRSQAIAIIPLIGNGTVKNLWILEYRNTQKEINFTHVYIIAECLVMLLQNEGLAVHIKRMAFYDQLTEIRNRNGMYQYMNKSMLSAKLEGRGFVFCVFDIDHFKRFNDTYGHKMGDFILKALAQSVKGLLDKMDLVARWGGEEFVICIPDVDLKEGIDRIENIRKEISQTLFTYGDQDFNITCSFGVACFRGNDTVDALFKRADSALCAAKESGRDQVKVEGRMDKDEAK